MMNNAKQRVQSVVPLSLSQERELVKLEQSHIELLMQLKMELLNLHTLSR
jgi:hypothetical protein